MARVKKPSYKTEALSFFNENWAVAELKVTYLPSFHTNIVISNSDQIFIILKEFWKDRMVDYLEMLVAVFLNNRNEVIGYKVLSTGSMTATTVDIRYICTLSLLCGAACVVLAHNHPSGSLIPSQSDISVGKKAKQALASLDVCLQDYLIVTSSNYQSVIYYF